MKTPAAAVLCRIAAKVYGVEIVESLAREAMERLASLGCAPGDVKEFKDGAGALIARYFFVQDPDGYKIEVLERHGHYH